MCLVMTGKIRSSLLLLLGGGEGNRTKKKATIFRSKAQGSYCNSALTSLTFYPRHWIPIWHLTRRQLSLDRTKITSHLPCSFQVAKSPFSQTFNQFFFYLPETNYNLCNLCQLGRYSLAKKKRKSS